MLARTTPQESWTVEESTHRTEYRLVLLDQAERVDLAEGYRERDLLWSPEASAVQRRTVRTYSDGREEKMDDWRYLVFAKTPRDALLRMFDGDWWQAESLHPAHAWAVSRYERLSAIGLEKTQIEGYIEAPKGRGYSACEEHWQEVFERRLKEARLYTASAKGKLSEAQKQRVDDIRIELRPQMIADRQQRLDRRAMLKAETEAIEAEPMPAIEHPYAYKENAYAVANEEGS
jgi:hypothetical protein